MYFTDVCVYKKLVATLQTLTITSSSLRIVSSKNNKRLLLAHPASTLFLLFIDFLKPLSYLVVYPVDSLKSAI